MTTIAEGFYWAQCDDGEWTVAEQQNGRLWVIGDASKDWTPADFTRLVPLERPADLV